MSRDSHFRNSLRNSRFIRQGRRSIAVLAMSLALLLAPIIGSVPTYAAPIVTTYQVPTPNAFPYRITKGSDGALWFTEAQSNKIGRITNAGVITEFQVPGPYFNPRDIVAGPDGALWFTSTVSTSIYRITTAGVVSTFSAQSYPASLTVGPDGAIWFTAQTLGTNTWRIGRMTTAGAVTAFSTPGSTGGFMDITSGPDGALWFTEQGNAAGENRIGRISTSGAYSHYATPHTSSFPFAITTGPDGALWFTETNAAFMGRVDTSGNITEFPIPSGEHLASGIAIGSDGALWFTSGSSYSVGRITTAGVVNEYAVPATNGGGLTGISNGFDGAIWYIQSGNISAIGRITTPEPTLVQAINAGGGASGTFSADANYNGGSSYSSTLAVDRSAASNPAPESVYQTVRYGNTLSYAFSGLTANASYTLRLHFNELYWGAGSNGGGPSSRVFNVAVNGQGVLSNYDIYQQAGGANKAIIEQLPVQADANGAVNIQFSTVTDNAMVNGIELYEGTLPPQPPHPTPTFSPIINAGGGASGAFSADSSFTGGSSYSSAVAVDTTGVTNPAPQSVYQTVRYGNFSYVVPQLTPAANYRVRLHFNELYWGAGGGGGVGSRVFNVALNGSTILSNYDIYSRAGGANKAIVEEFVIPANAQGAISFQFSSVVDNAMVSGIEIQPEN